MGTFNINNLLGGGVAGDLSKLGQSGVEARLNAAQSAGTPVQTGFGEKLLKLIEAGEYEGLKAVKAAGRDLGIDAGAGDANNIDDSSAVTLEGAGALLGGLDAIDAIGADAEGSDAAKVSFVNALTVEERLRMGNELLAYAFKRIASLLDAPEEEFSGSLVVAFNPEDAEQYAAVMWYLDLTVNMINEKEIVAFVEDAKQNFGPDAAADEAAQEDSAALTELANGLRKEKFHLEMAFRLIGVHEAISAMAAEKGDRGVAVGIPQAANPAGLGMTTSDLAHAFGSLISEELTSAMERVRMITSGQAEMTDLEKAAVRLGTVNSEILKAALNGAGAPNSAVFENISLEAAKPASAEHADNEVKAEIKAEINANVKADANVDTGVNTEIKADAKADANTEIKAAVKADVKAEINDNGNAKSAAKKAADGFELPFSARESAGNRARDRVEAANRMAFESVNAVVKVKDSGAGLPISARESANKGVADSVTPASGKAAEAADVSGARIKASAAVNDVVIPVSAKEAVSKSAANSGAPVEKAVSGNTSAEVQVKTVSNANVEIPVSAKESVNKSAVNGGAPVETVTPGNTNAEARVKTVSGGSVEVPVSAGEPANVKAPENAASTVNKVPDDADTPAKADSAVVNNKTDGVETAVKLDKEAVSNKAGDGVNTYVKLDKEAVSNKADDGVNTAVKLDKEVVSDKAAGDVNTAVKPDEVPVKDNVSDGVNTAVKLDKEVVSNKAAGDVNTAVKLDKDVVSNKAAGDVNTSVKLDKDVVNNKAAGNVNTAVKPDSVHVNNNIGDGDSGVVNAHASDVLEPAGGKPSDNRKSGGSADTPTPRAFVNTEKSTAAVNTANSDTAGNRPETLAQNDFAAKFEQGGADTNGGGARQNAGGKTESANNAGDGGGKTSINDSLTFSGLENGVAEPESASSDGSEFSSAEPASPKAASVEHTEKAQAATSRFDSEAVIRQINERLQQAVRNGVHEVRMTLRPEALGEVRMSIRVEGDVVMARMQVENRQVKAIVESNLQSLKDTLEKHNMQFGAVSVDVGTDTDTGRSPRQAWQDLAEAAEMSGARRFREVGAAAGADVEEAGALGGVRGGDTGRRFGNNTFEYFI